MYKQALDVQKWLKDNVTKKDLIAGGIGTITGGTLAYLLSKKYNSDASILARLLHTATGASIGGAGAIGALRGYDYFTKKPEPSAEEMLANYNKVLNHGKEYDEAPDVASVVFSNNQPPEEPPVKTHSINRPSVDKDSNGEPSVIPVKNRDPKTNLPYPVTRDSRGNLVEIRKNRDQFNSTLSMPTYNTRKVWFYEPSLQKFKDRIMDFINSRR